MGFTSGTYEATWTGPDGKPVTETGKYLCTWQKQPDGSWKAVHDMWNSDTK
jgi:ketosteroid isomerase-like protein